MNRADSTKRFSDRVDNYIKYRPRYPQAIVDFLQSAIGLSPQALVADIGSGTGFLAELFLKNGNRVIGVEPNVEMRLAGDAYLTHYSQFSSIEGRAEATNLDAQSVNLISAGQAFHWFDVPKTRAEFVRVLAPNGYVVLIWNSRRLDTPFMQAYEAILHHFADNYKGVSEHNVLDEHIAAFFAPQPMQLKTFTNVQIFDFEGLQGRALSSSYSPAPGNPTHQAFIGELDKLFRQFQQDGVVRIEYVTRLYWGRLSRVASPMPGRT